MAFFHSTHIIRNGLKFYIDPLNSKCYTYTLDSSSIIHNLIPGIVDSSIRSGVVFEASTNSFAWDGSVGSCITCKGMGWSTGLPFTMCFWVNPQSNDNYRSIVYSVSGTRLMINNAGTLYAQFKPTAYYGATGSILNNKWTYVVYKHEPPYEYLYVNGVMNIAPQTLDSSVTWSANFGIGQATALTYYPYKGNISAVSFYNRALSSSEIYQNYIALKGRFGLI